jgi:hypothetical protein
MNNRTVTSVQVNEQNELALGFDGGTRRLMIDGSAAAFTTHEVWWLSEL